MTGYQRVSSEHAIHTMPTLCPINDEVKKTFEASAVKLKMT